MNRILILGKVLPESASSAAGLRMMQLIQLFLENGSVIIFATPASPSEFADDLSRLHVEVKQVNINDSAFDQWLKKTDPDLVIFDRFTTEEQFGWRVAQQCPSALRVLDTEDLHFLRSARQQAVKENRQVVTADYFSDLAKREIAAIYRSDLSLIISEFEMKLLQKDFDVPANLLHYLPLFCEAEINLPRPAFGERHHFISIGNFLHEPNWDAVLRLKEKIWPLIRKELPAAALHVYGAYAGAKALQLNNPAEGFLIKGRCEDASQVLSGAKVLLAPLRFGAGLKGKLLDAMLSGTPSVTTPIGSEGIADGEDWPGAIARDEADFAKAATSLYQHKEKWTSAQAKGFKIIKEKFSAGLHIAPFILHLKKLEKSLQEHRGKNFTGAMLMHHLSQSTRYMSMWIEAKNQNKSASESRH